MPNHRNDIRARRNIAGGGGGVGDSIAVVYAFNHDGAPPDPAGFIDQIRGQFCAAHHGRANGCIGPFHRANHRQAKRIIVIQVQNSDPCDQGKHPCNRGHRQQDHQEHIPLGHRPIAENRPPY